MKINRSDFLVFQFSWLENSKYYSYSNVGIKKYHLKKFINKVVFHDFVTEIKLRYGRAPASILVYFSLIHLH